MAYLDVDPMPMLLSGFSRVLVEGTQKFVRVVTSRARPSNEDPAIVIVSNLPLGEIPFADICNIILGLLEEDYGLRVTEIQRCPFGRGQADVRLSRASDRDSLVIIAPTNFME